MRYLMVCVVWLGLGNSSLLADGISELAGLGSYFQVENGSLNISLSHHWLIWINGERQFFYRGEGHEVNLKPGDVLVAGEVDYGFHQYKLERLTKTKATFTIWDATAIREQIAAKSWNIRPGEFTARGQFTVDLPLEINDDSESNKLELDPSKVSRTK